jgi:hypothetical protein
MVSRALAVFLSAVCAAGGRAAAQRAEPSFGPNFLFVRYASRTALTLYGSYGRGDLLLFAGMVQNPRTEYREAIGGVGLNLPLGNKASAVAATAVASATDSWYAQLYLLPSWTAGRLSVNGTFELYEPLQRAGARQLDVNPCAVLWRLVDRVEVGVAYLLFAQMGGAPTQEAGPTVRVTVPHGSLTSEFFGRIGTGLAEVRLTFQAAP